MKLSEVAIGRPVLASMMSAALVLFGVIGYTRLSVCEVPDIDPPITSSSTTLPGVKARLQSLAGVGSAGVYGERRFAMRVWVQPDQLSARGLTVQDVESAITSRNVEIPAGRIESTRREFSVRSLGELKTPREFGELAVASQGTQLVKLKDVARVELGPEDDRSIFRYNGSPAVAIGVVRQSKANLIDVARNIREALPSIQQTLPPGVKLQTAWDGSVFVTHSINDARLTLLIAAILVVLIIFVFLRNVRATIIPGLAIPASIVATFATMYFLGFSINNFTLLALTIAIGIVVDDAIILLENAYRRQEELPQTPLQHRGIVVAGTVVTVALAFVLYRNLKQELIPDDDRGFFLVVGFGPEGSSLEYTDGYVRQVEQIIGKVPEVQGYFTIIGGFAGGVNRAFVGVILKDWSERHRSVQQLVGMLFPQLFGIAGLQAFPYSPGALGFSQPVQFVVQNPDIGRLAQAMDTLVPRARAIKGLTNIDTDLRFNKPELRVTFDRDRAEDLGVPVRDVAAALQTFLGGRRVSTFTRNDKLYYVMLQLDPSHRNTPSDMSGIYLRGRGGQLVQLAALAKVDEGVGPRQINHFNRVPSFTLSASLIPPFAQGEALDSLDRLARQVLPPGSTTALAGDSREFKESGGALYFAFGVALLVVFMVLASQFESLVHPFTVLLAVPLAVTGALATLLLAALLHRPGGTINLYSEIGMVLLIGLVTKNSILLVEYTNQLKARGMETLAAVIEAGRIRLRPILMTSVATIMGAIPVMIGLGAGSTPRRPLGYAIVGGIFFSTVLTLFVVPVGYVLLDRLTARKPSHVRVAQPVEAD